MCSDRTLGSPTQAQRRGRTPCAAPGRASRSLPPALSAARQPGSIPAAGSGRSAAMIALTAILSILFAVLLAGLVAMLVFWG